MSLVFIGISPLILYGYTRWENRLLHPYTCSDEQDTCPLERHRTLACPRTDHRRENKREQREEGIERSTMIHHYSLSLWCVKWHMGWGLPHPYSHTSTVCAQFIQGFGFRLNKEQECFLRDCFCNNRCIQYI